MPGCQELDFETRPLPVLCSHLRLQAKFTLGFAQRFLFVFFPERIIEKKRRSFEAVVCDFLEIQKPYLQSHLPYFSSLIKKFTHPRTLIFDNLTYARLSISPKKDFKLVDRSVIPLFCEDQVDCFFRLYSLKKIIHFWKSRAFLAPYPYVGEIYIKVKERYKDGSFGPSKFEFQGRFLEKKTDQYLLAYWNLEPIWEEGLLEMLPKDLFQNIAKTKTSPAFREDLFLHLGSSLSCESVDRLKPADDRVSIS